MLVNSLTFAKIGLKDLPLLARFSRETFFDAFAHLNSAADMESYAAKAFSLERLEEEINDADSEFYFAIAQNKVAGYLKLNYRDAQTDFKDPRALQIERIYIAKEKQGQQIGKQLMQFAIDTAKRFGMDYVWLGVWQQNHGAIRFYQSFGFLSFSSHLFILGSDHQTDVLMKLKL